MSQDHWRNQAAPNQGDPQQSPRGFGGFGGSASQPSHILPPPPSNYPPHLGPQPSHQQSQGGHSLSIADLTQGPPAPSQYNTQPPPAAAQPYSMGSLHQSPDYMARLRDARARDEQEMREREKQEQERIQRYAREQQQAPIHNSTGSIPLHQPVASKVQGSLQGPNGLLSGGGGVAAHNPSLTNASSQAFGPPSGNLSQPYLTQPSPGITQQQVIANGQQPILNDALSYLDQVKVRFSDQPDVYNRFLDIMKDFKSQAIDTPGVINRVSELFNGHPALIQGFNTFLPPGYRIECGTDENPDAIRVTTPSGTMTQSMQSRPRGVFDAAGAGSYSLTRQDTIESNRPWGPQISPGSRPARLPGYEPAHDGDRYEHDVTAMQEQQRNVSHLQNAATAAANGQMRPVQGSSPPPSMGGSGQATGLFLTTANGKRGGPLEFNHAIDYVNKIKNRFAQQPEIYKQFLEILQTYQRESKPIQEVYAQVTQLFLNAPDLLEGFKQFLPESAAHAKAQANRQEELSSVRNEPAYGLPQTHTPRPAAKLPPMGQFDPPSTSKDNRKRKAPGAGAPALQTGGPTDTRLKQNEASSSNKRQKFDPKQKIIEVPNMSPVDPTLIPALPEPLPPAPTMSVTQEELALFERAKKQIGNRASYTEFLKLVNMFTQDIIDKYALVDRIYGFIGNNNELMAAFKSLLGISEHEDIVEARLRPDSGRVNLAYCRGYGPSYRHLPKRDQNKACKGRDGMCYQVLNDVWASHPTWASEDSGFVAHRKNQYEEALHRIEEERHDYDFHIESCQRTIQLMDPLVAQINAMNDQEKAANRVDKGFGGASEAIPKRIILKIYGREVGNKVLEDMFKNSAQVMPVVLNRLKQKLEEWKQVQREWEKVWRDQINKQFYKSLDHQGIAQKTADKKNFASKSLTAEIQARYEENKLARDRGMKKQKFQLDYYFKDQSVLLDTTRLILTALQNDSKADVDASMQGKIKDWLLDFVVRFFGLDKVDFVARVEATVQAASSPGEDGESDNDSDTPAQDSRRPKGKHGNLLQKALKSRNGKETSAAPTSQESTPAPDAMSVTSAEQDTSATEDNAETPKQWLNMQHATTTAKAPQMNDLYSHDTFNFYTNSNLYCFFRLFEMLYSRLLGIKKSETSVAEAVKRSTGTLGKQKPALALDMIDKTPADFFKFIDGSVSYYEQILGMCCDLVMDTMDKEHLEETLRRFYNHNGWQLYSVERLLFQILKTLILTMSPDSKEKSLEIANLFFKDRERTETSRKIEVQYRKQVEKMSKDGEIFRISWHPDEQWCTISLFPPEKMTYSNDELSDEAKWQYYIASFAMAEPTEGIDSAHMRKVFLQRNVPTQSNDPRENYAKNIGNLDYVDEQAAYVDIDSYKLILQGLFAFERQGVTPTKEYPVGEILPNEAFREKFVRNVAWMKDQSADDVEARKTAWEKAIKDGFEDAEE